MIDPTGFLLTGIRDNASVSAITERIRADMPGPGDAAWVIDPATGAKRYKNRFVVLYRQGGRRLDARNAVQLIHYGFRTYGVNPQDATVLYGVVSDAAHDLEPRVNASGIAIWNSRVIEDGGAAVDPDTKQPYEEGVIEVLAPTQVVAL